jgi:polyhydroxybutyrate depolymerase
MMADPEQHLHIDVVIVFGGFLASELNRDTKVTLSATNRNDCCVVRNLASKRLAAVVRTMTQQIVSLQKIDIHPRGRPCCKRPSFFSILSILLIHWCIFWSAHSSDVSARSDWSDSHATEGQDETKSYVLASPALRRETLSLTAIQRLNFYLGAERSLRHDGLRRWFMEHQPANMPTDGSAALLITLHWGFGNMRSSDYAGRVREKDPWLDLAWDRGFLILSPDATSVRKYFKFLGLKTRGLNQNWNDLLGGIENTGADDVGFIAALIDWAATKRNIDRSRVYVTGISNGATMSQRLVIERPELFAAATSFNGNLPVRDIPLPSAGTPVFLMNGTNDTYIPYYGGPSIKNRGVVRSAEATRDYFVAANQAGPDMVETLLPDVDPNDECRIVSQYFPSDTAPVQFYRLAGGGHQPAVLGELPPALNSILESLVGNSCHDIDSYSLAYQFMFQFTRK